MVKITQISIKTFMCFKLSPLQSWICYLIVFYKFILAYVALLFLTSLLKHFSVFLFLYCQSIYCSTSCTLYSLCSYYRIQNLSLTNPTLKNRECWLTEIFRVTNSTLKFVRSSWYHLPLVTIITACSSK